MTRYRFGTRRRCRCRSGHSLSLLSFERAAVRPCPYNVGQPLRYQGVDPEPRSGYGCRRLQAVLRRTVRAYEHNHNFYLLTISLGVATDPVARSVFREFSDHFFQVMGSVLQDTADDDAAIIVLMATAVLGSLLRNWSSGLMPIRRVYTDLDAAVEIIFSVPRPRRTRARKGARATSGR
jgi:hypothetical protein